MPSTMQLPIIVDVLSAAGITMAWADGYEADDIIGTLAAQASEPVEVVTGDRDLFQLVDDERRIRVAYIAKGLANLELVDEAAVTARYQIPGRSLRRVRRSARRSERRTARRARRGREDGGRAGPRPSARSRRY